jgi:hypothetical protein
VRFAPDARIQSKQGREFRRLTVNIGWQVFEPLTPDRVLKGRLANADRPFRFPIVFPRLKDIRRDNLDSLNEA